MGMETSRPGRLGAGRERGWEGAAPPRQVTECLQELEGRLQELEEAWALRRQRCAESWGLQKLRQRLEQAEAWLACREGLLLKPAYGVSGGPAPSPATRLRAPPELGLTRTCFSPALSVRCGVAATQTPGLRKAAGSPGKEVCPNAEDRGEECLH
ncbi:hypothetical protein H8959_016932 [Pygathrix nigripes]